MNLEMKKPETISISFPAWTECGNSENAGGNSGEFTALR